MKNNMDGFEKLNQDFEEDAAKRAIEKAALGAEKNEDIYNKGLTGFIGKTAASYRQYLNAANQQAFMAARRAQMRGYYQSYYWYYHNLLCMALCNTCEMTKLLRPNRIRGLATNQSPVVDLNGKGRYACHYVGYKKSGYSNITMESINRTLNAELSELSAIYGFFPSLKVHAWLKPDGSGVVDFIVYQ